MSDPRTEQLAHSLALVRERVERACRAAGRDSSEVCLVVVTKTFPADDVARLAALGVRDVGENRDGEAAAKAAELADCGLRWHFVGQVQRAKARSVARYAHVVHSLDRPALVQALERACLAAGRRVEVLLQVNLDQSAGSTGRGGAVPEDIPALAAEVATTSALVLRGVMAVAPLGADPAPAFARLRDVATRLREEHEDATWVSAGMSGDLEQAVAAGATHLRVGTAILGQRPPLQ